MTVRLVVLAERSLPRLLAAYPEPWVAGLQAAMLRDTLDGLMTADAHEHLVVAADDEAAALLARHVHAPWRVVRALDASDADVTLFARSSAPSAPTAALPEALTTADARFALLGVATSGAAWLFGGRGVGAVAELPWSSAAALRATCNEIAVREIGPAIVVDEPADLQALMEELRADPSLAPRTAQFLVTRG